MSEAEARGTTSDEVPSSVSLIRSTKWQSASDVIVGSKPGPDLHLYPAVRNTQVSAA